MNPGGGTTVEINARQSFETLSVIRASEIRSVMRFNAYRKLL